MSTNLHASSTPTSTVRLGRRAALAAVVGLSAILGAPAGAQGLTPTQRVAPAFEIRPFVGAYVPTGDQRDLLKDAVLVGGQLSWVALPSVALTGSFGWAPSKDRVTAGDQTLDVFQYDVGAELRAPAWYRSGSIDFSPFVGLGGGGRTYSYRDLDVDAKTFIAGYGAVGGDLGLGAVALRVELRDYVSRFTPLVGGGDAKARNDIGLAAGLSYRF